MDLQKSSTLSFVRKLLSLVWVMTIIGVAVLVVMLLVTLFRPESLPGSIELGLGWWGPGITVRLPSAAFAPDIGRLLLVTLGFTLASSPMLLIILYELRRILSNVASQTPFTLENAARIRYIGLAVLASAAVKNVRDFTFAKFIMETVKVPGVDLGVKVSLGLEIIGVGLLILLVAEIFRYGVRLQEDHDFTV